MFPCTRAPRISRQPPRVVLAPVGVESILLTLHSKSKLGVKPPTVIHWCAQHCTTWTLDKGAPFDKPHYGSRALGSTVIVERFSRESVIMRRTDYRPYPGVALLAGRLSADGRSIVNGTIQWTYHPCCGLSTGRYQAAWGAGLETVPGSDVERGRRMALCSATSAPNQPNTARTNPGEPIPCNDRGSPPATSE